MRKLISLLILALVSGCSPSKEALEQNTKENVMALVRPITYDAHGTGFELEYNGRVYTITNSHVCDLSPKMLVAFKDNTVTRIGLKVRKQSEETDLCALDALPNKRPSTVLHLGNSFYIGQPIFTAGFPGSGPLFFSEGFITEPILAEVPESIEPSQCHDLFKLWIDDPMSGQACVTVVNSYSTTMIGLPGDSGSPVLDTDGNVVGVVWATNETHNAAIIPLWDLKKFLESL